MRHRGLPTPHVKDFHKLIRKPGHFFVLCLLTLLPVAASAQKKPEDVRKMVKEAVKLTRAGAFRDSEELLRRAVQLEPRRSEAKLELARVLAKQRRLREAYDLCIAVAQDEPRNARAYSVLGYILVTAGRFKEARPVLANALKLDSSEHLAYASFGLLDFYENRIEYSLSNLYAAKHYAPREPDYLFAFAQVSARAENYNDSAAAYADFLRYSSDTDIDRRARIKGLISFLSYLGSIFQLYVPDGKNQTNIPFTLEDERPIIELRINNKPQPLRFVLDTGSGISVLSEETAKRLKVKAVARGGYAKGLGGDGKFEIVYGLLREIDLGDVSVKNVPIYIRKFHNDARKIDGYIGLSLISKFLTTIDYANGTFTLTRKESDARQFRESNAMSLPLRLTSSGFLSGEVELEGLDAPLNFIVDTGASISVISDRVARIEPVSRYVRDGKLRVIGAAGITDDMPTFTLPRVTFGKNSRRDIAAVALDLDLINEASGFEQAGILGGNFLKNYRLTFDFKNSKVVFEPIAAEN
jgi:predicted aspartyl protease/thioredoxin-like negative regulator of GroEL